MLFTLAARTGALDSGTENSVAGFWSDAQTFNAWVRAQKAAGKIDAVVDIALDPYLGDAATCANTTYFVDGLHETTYAHGAILTPLVVQALKSL